MYITINGGELFFDVYGPQLKITQDAVSKKPTLIVLHGGLGFADHTLYVQFWSQLQDIVQVIFIDQHGCGRSDKGSPATWNLNRWGSDIIEFCHKLGIEKPIVAGVSMGGHVIGEIVRQRAELLGGIILCNTEARFDVEGLSEQFVKKGLPESAEANRNFYYNPTPETWKAYQQHCLPHYAKNAYSPAELGRCMRQEAVFMHAVKDYVLKFDYRQDLETLTCPALIMAGERGSHTPESAQEMADHIPKQYLHYHLFKDAGAPVYKDEPVEAEKVVRDFLVGICKQ